MSYRIDPTFLTELERYGAETISDCFNCGNCTAVCGLTKNETTFPRQQIRMTQLGLRDKVAESIEPWLCYYCGDCSDTCPREAEPGELMMATRRWLTAKYDWTGLGRLMYKSVLAEMGVLILVAIVVMLLFMLPANFGFRLLEGDIGDALHHVDLAAFAPKHVVHTGDITMALLLMFFLATNALRMMYFTMRNTGATIADYIAEMPQFIIHLLTQKRWADCDKNSTKHWVRHIFLVTGYATMFLLVVVFLLVFQIEDASWHWTSLLGYYATVILLLVPTWMLIDRMRGEDQIHKHSHLSDWLFPILLLLTSITGIMMHIFRLADWAMGTYVIYMIHLMIAVPMLVVEVPFSKWSHLIYRPLAVYLHGVKARVARRALVTKQAVN